MRDVHMTAGSDGVCSPCHVTTRTDGWKAPGVGGGRHCPGMRRVRDEDCGEYHYAMIVSVYHCGRHDLQGCCCSAPDISININLLLLS